MEIAQYSKELRCPREMGQIDFPEKQEYSTLGRIVETLKGVKPLPQVRFVEGPWVQIDFVYE
jgi:hypothetical protein